MAEPENRVRAGMEIPELKTFLLSKEPIGKQHIKDQIGTHQHLTIPRHDIIEILKIMKLSGLNHLLMYLDSAKETSLVNQYKNDSTMQMCLKFNSSSPFSGIFGPIDIQ
jgi:hypothetical protein